MLVVLKLANFDAFSASIRRLQDHVKEVPQKLAKELIIDINQITIGTSRTDTGRYVGGWQISFNKPVFATNPYADGVSRKSQEAQIKAKQITDNEQKALTFKGGTIFLANNVEYAIYREFGTPTQKPDYTLTLAIQATINRLNKIVRELEFKG